MEEKKRGPYRMKDEIVSLEECDLSEAQQTGQRIRNRMLEYGITQEALAEELELSKATINGILGGNKPIPSSCMRKLSDTLHLSLDYIFGLNESPTINEDVKAAEKITGLTRESILNLKQIGNTDLTASTTGALSGTMDINRYISSYYFKEVISSFNRATEYAHELSVLIDVVQDPTNDVAGPIETTKLQQSMYEYNLAANNLIIRNLQTDQLLRKAAAINEIFYKNIKENSNKDE